MDRSDQLWPIELEQPFHFQREAWGRSVAAACETTCARAPNAAIETVRNKGRTEMKKLLMAGVAVAALATPTYAAQIWVNPAEGHGHVIHIKGAIEKGDANRFANAVGKVGVRPGDATVWLDSPGGLVMEGIPIARAIKKYGWNTYVAADTACASMCADIWLAGHTRFISSHGKVGFHSTGDKKHPGVRNEFGTP
jgi:hypothetical protein